MILSISTATKTGSVPLNYIMKEERMTNGSMPQIEDIVRDLPMFDSVIQKILNMVNREDTTAIRLESVIKEDAVLSLKILKLANSSFFSPVQPITSIAHAVRYIGFSTLKSLVYSIALQSMGGKGKKVSADLKALHNKMVVNAIITLMIGKYFLTTNRFIFTPDDFYMFGLFHDIGLLAVASYDETNLYLPILEQVKKGQKLLEADQQIPHCQVGARLMEKWEIPEIFRNFTRQHHDAIAEGDKLFIPYQIIRLAEYFSYCLGYDTFAEKELDAATLLRSLNLKPADFYDSNNQLTPVKTFVDNLLAGFGV